MVGKGRTGKSDLAGINRERGGMERKGEEVRGGKVMGRNGRK